MFEKKIDKNYVELIKKLIELREKKQDVPRGLFVKLIRYELQDITFTYKDRKYGFSYYANDDNFKHAEITLGIISEIPGNKEAYLYSHFDYKPGKGFTEFAHVYDDMDDKPLFSPRTTLSKYVLDGVKGKDAIYRLIKDIPDYQVDTSFDDLIDENNKEGANDNRER